MESIGKGLNPRSTFWVAGVAGLVLVLFYAPLIGVVLKAFMSPEGGWGFYWFRELFSDSSFFMAVKNSFLLATVTSVLSVLLSLIFILRAPFPLRLKSRSGFYGKIMMVSLGMPEIILALSLLSLLTSLQFELGFGSLIVAHTTLTLAFSYWILSLQFDALDPSLIEAAVDLGADEKTLLTQVILPQMKPGIISGFWMCFLLSLDDFLITFFVSGSSYETLPLKLFAMLKMGLSPKINALSFLILLISSVILAMLYPKLKRLSGGRGL